MSAADTERRFIMTDGSSVNNEHRCPHSWFGSHRFEPRYDCEPVEMEDMDTPAIVFMGERNLTELLTKRAYVRDICTKCGKTIERVK